MKSRKTAGFLAIFLGAYGAHWFYLKRKKKATQTLLISLLTFGVGACVMKILGIIQGVRFFKSTEEDFQAEYGNAAPVAEEAPKAIEAPAEVPAATEEEPEKKTEDAE